MKKKVAHNHTDKTCENTVLLICKVWAFYLAPYPLKLSQENYE